MKTSDALLLTIVASTLGGIVIAIVLALAGVHI
jgi:hypothetical protein